jgi:hypothetical protein
VRDDGYDPARYSTHLPILRRVVHSVRPKRVLEFGAGLHSTPLYFRDPQLWNVVCIEPDPEWRQKVAYACDDSRLILREAATDVTPADFDLIFIDDGECPRERLRTINFVLSQPHPTVVIHDAEVPEYRHAIEELAISHKTYKTDPDTCVVWS